MQPQQKIAFINGLRGLAIIGPVWHHLYYDAYRYGTVDAGVPLWLNYLLSSGHFGVSLFFILSGIVLYLPYATGSRAMETVADAKAFKRRRALRLLPLYFLAAFVSLAFPGQVLNSKTIIVLGVLYATIMFPIWPNTFTPPTNPVLWSLGTEIWFSWMFPSIVRRIKRHGMTIVLVAAFVLSLAVRWAGQAATVPGTGPTVGPFLSFISDSVLGRLNEFVLGMALAHLMVRRQLGWANGAVAGMGIALVLLSVALWGGWASHQLPFWTIAFGLLPIDIGLFCIIGYAASGKPQRLLAALENRPLQLLGMMCFSIYVWHDLIRVHVKPDIHNPFAVSAYLGLTLVISAVTYRFVEFWHVRDWRMLLPAAEKTPEPVTV